MPSTSTDTIAGLPDWLRSLQAAIQAQQACVLISLVKTQGSVPREVGARMLITAHTSSGTIGGGHLEWKVLQRARSLFNHAQALSSIETFTLGPQLDQCCGGVATVHYEYFPLADVSWLETVLQRWQQGLSTCLQSYPQAWPESGRGRVALLNPEAETSSALSEQADGSFCLTEQLSPAHSNLIIFGAGHVAQALVQVLLPLDWHITWVDSRAGLFPKLAAGQATVKFQLINPLEFASQAVSAGSFCLVMTHEHSLDLELCALLLERDDLNYVGLIGSRTKAARFRKRLSDQGLSPIQGSRLVCPIGLGNIHSKQPAAIAISVAAQLLQLREERNHVAVGASVHELA